MNALPNDRPFYLLNEDKIIANLARIQQVKDATGCTILMALKAFSHYKVFPLLAQTLDGCTASSRHEARLAHEYFPGHHHAYSPAYSPRDFPEWIDYCQTFTANSLQQVDFLQNLPTQHNLEIGLRINPLQREASNPLYDPSSPQSRLGVTAKALKNQWPKGVTGLHVHNLCENDSHSLERTIEAIERDAPFALEACQWINLGGGHMISQRDYDLNHLIQLIDHLQKTYSLRVILEPGAAVVWEAGNLHAHVLDIVAHDEVATALLDVSITAHMPDCIEMPYTPQVREGRITDKGCRYRLGGNSCLAGDFVGDYHFEHGLFIGDEVVFLDMAHYTTVKTHFFNGVHHPSVYLQHTDGSYTCLKTFDYTDYQSRL